MRFNLGDYVTRPIDIYDPRSRMRYGRVRTVERRHGELIYGVQWDGSMSVDPGYFAHGLEAAVDGAHGMEQRDCE